MPSRKNFPVRMEARRRRAWEKQNAASCGSTVGAPLRPISGPEPTIMSSGVIRIWSALKPVVWDSFWPIYLYVIMSVVIAGSAAVKVGWTPAFCTIIASFLSLVSGGGLKASVLWRGKAQKIGGFVIALVILGLAQWSAEGFSVGFFGNQLSGDLWCWTGFVIGLIFTSRKLAGMTETPALRAPTEKSSAELLGALGELMERYPTALLDSSRLPAPKQQIKAAIKNVWKAEPRLRSMLAHAYLFLSHFQDGIGSAVLDCKIPAMKVGADGAPDRETVMREAREIAEGPTGENVRQWLMWSKVSLAEAEILSQEWRAFEAQTNA